MPLRRTNKYDDNGAIKPCFAPIADHQVVLGGFIIDDFSNRQYISPAGLTNLKYYKYTGQDNSLIGNLFLFRFHTWLCHTFFPLWLAPNVITLAGLTCNCLAMLLLVFYVEPVFGGFTDQSWVYVAIGVLLLSYQALDNIDGKQARRTGTGSAFGELMDHICDCVCVTVFMMIAASAVGTSVWVMYWLAWCSLFVFHLSHWEEYYKGELIMDALTGPTEAVLAIVSVCFGTALFGPDVWSLPTVLELDLKGLLSVVMSVGCIVSCAQRIYGTVSECRKLRASVAVAFAELLPLLSLCASNLVWLYVAPTTLERAPVVFTLQAGLAVANLETRRLTQRICRERAPWLYLSQLPTALATVLAVAHHVNWLSSFDDVAAAKMLLVVNGAMFSYLVFTLADQLTTALRIRVFTIPSAQ